MASPLNILLVSMQIALLNSAPGTTNHSLKKNLKTADVKSHRQPKNNHMRSKPPQKYHRRNVRKTK